MRIGPLQGHAWCFNYLGWRFGIWFRLFGRGLHISNHPLTFSQRYGHTKYVRVFGIKFVWLRPE